MILFQKVHWLLLPAGTVEGIFTIPDPNVRGNPKFRTGDRLFRLTSSPSNKETPEPETFAQTIFSSTGILTTMQETFIHTRNARVETRNLFNKLLKCIVQR